MLTKVANFTGLVIMLAMYVRDHVEATYGRECIRPHESVVQNGRKCLILSSPRDPILGILIAVGMERTLDVESKR